MIGWIATGPRWSRPKISAPVGKPIAGYEASALKMTQEYLRFYGKPLDNAGIERAFDQANQRVNAGDYTKAVGLLEGVSKVAAVPVVFNNLGVLYAELIDTSSALNAFREALARDINYPAVRLNLDRMKDVMALGADPVTREVESNNNASVANIIAPGKAVEGEIDAAFNDEDFFRVTTPPAPRDLVSIEIANHSATLAPVLKIFDAEKRMTNWGKIGWAPGSSLQQTIAPAPNTTLYLQLSGHGGSAGAYTLLVQPQRSFDAYEPNDDIYNSRRIPLGMAVAAGIMDASDTDYYSFVSPRTQTVSIAIRNQSTTLIPALGTFNPDMRSSGSGPDVRTPGLNLRHTMQVQQDQVYYIQVRSRANTAGEYSVIIE
ncbi:MAG: hypothetical protein NTW28_27060 [Candidatus Solibacter sp.]|nr:hypothetical protein [Candidatus Solibacter sp.]